MAEQRRLLSIREVADMQLLSADDVAGYLSLTVTQASALMRRMHHVLLGHGKRQVVKVMASRLRRVMDPDAFPPEKEHRFRKASRARLLARQGHACAVCGVVLESFGHLPHEACVDHCHRTALVRGILCGRCNRSLGAGFDSPEILRRAATYVEKWQFHGKVGRDG